MRRKEANMKMWLTGFLMVILAAAYVPLMAQRFYADDPVQKDNDSLDTLQRPAEIALSDYFDRFAHMFFDFGASPIGNEAANVNTLDEVPNSSWFTNRHGVRRLTIEELKRGPNSGSGPDPLAVWEITRGKTQGLTPGFHIRDESGEQYVIKLDPMEVPEIASAAEIIATKIFYAIGYNVPENYIVYRSPGTIEIAPGTMVEDRFGDKVPLTQFRYKRMVRRIKILPDGTARLMASKYIPGDLIGPFRYYETRTDDPNDIIPHEDRRELRGLRLFAAWTNHDDTRAHNTQDTWIDEGGRHYVKHYLMDFGSTFGSGSVGMQYAHLSYHYSMDFEMMKRNLLGFGFRVPQYRKVRWPPYPDYQAVGRWEGELFEPEEWKNDYPNPAFVRMTPRDAFWAAKIIMRFTPEELAAIVETGEFSDSRNAEYFLKVLIQRQKKCGKFGINGINPLDEFRVNGNILEFANMSAKYGFMEGTTRYRAVWSLFNNRDESAKTLGEHVTGTETLLTLPDIADRASNNHLFLLAEIHSINENYPQWNRSVKVYLRSVENSYEVVGIERSQ